MAWPVAFGMAAIAEKMIPWYLGSEFEPSIYAMMILAPIIVAIAASSLSANQYFLATNQTRIMTISYSFSAVLNLIINALLIPGYGFVGAAIGTIAAEYSVFVIQYYVMNKQIPIIAEMLHCLKYAFYSCIMFVVVWMFGKHSIPSVMTTMIQTCIGIVIYMVCLVITKDNFIFLMFNNIIHRRKNK